MRATTREIKRKVEEYVRKWKSIVCLGYWDVEINFGERKHLAANISQPPYLSAALYFKPTRIRRELASWEDLEQVVLHELVHSILWKLANRAGVSKAASGDSDIDELEEETTSTVAKAIWNAHQMGLASARTDE